MNAHERLLTAIDGGEPDHVPCALAFFHVDLENLGPRGWRWEGLVDVQFVRFPPSQEEEEFSRLARPYSPDTRLGTPAQMATYLQWEYRPETTEGRNPLAKARSLEDLQSFPFPDLSTPYHVDGLARQVRRLHDRGLAAGGNLPHLGGELFEAAWRLRGLENFLLDLLERPDWAHFLLDRLTDLACRNAVALAHAGIDVLALDDDVGMPRTMMISPTTWRIFFKPRLASIIQAARTIKPDLRVLYHSDGFFEPIVGDLVEIGVQAINPLQPDHMDAAHIRRQFGPRLALWGTVGRQTTFSFGSPDEIRQEVRQRIETLGRAGLILCPAYDVDEPDIPWDNIAAFLHSVHEYG
ncbi:MAG TPA: uroporphyrinogen decarboxylase family protein [Anaerolineae bacterium]|nr:uroporphyrinogen decarboxylase family protein [Anaerolineae bacterium]